MFTSLPRTWKGYVGSQMKGFLGPERVLKAVSPCGGGTGHTPGMWLLGVPTWKPSEPRSVGIFVHLSSQRHSQPLTPLLALLPSQDSGGQG